MQNAGEHLEATGGHVRLAQVEGPDYGADIRRKRETIVRGVRLSSLTVALVVVGVTASVALRAPAVRTMDERVMERAERSLHVGAPVTPADVSRITARQAAAATPLAAVGWAGELKLGVEDTWEPTIAADPSGPYLYVMYNRFGGAKACKQCPAIPMQLRVSSDNGVSWGPRPTRARAPASTGSSTTRS